MSHRLSIVAFVCFFISILTGCGDGPLLNHLSVSLKEGTTLPASVTAGSTVTVYFTVSNEGFVERSGIHILSLPEGVEQVTSGGTYADTCLSLFTLRLKGQSGSSCTLQLSISGPIAGSEENILLCLEDDSTCVDVSALLNILELNSITITPATAEVTIGNTQQYVATGVYSDASTADITSSVTWVSSATDKATVSTGGLVTAVAEGTSQITATFETLGSDPVPVEVTNPVISISITPTSVDIDYGTTQQFTALGTYADLSTGDVSSSVTWNSSQTDVATISSTGLAAGAGAGASTITASLDGITSNDATLNVANPLLSITVTPDNARVKIERTQQYTATGHFLDGSTTDITSSASWGSSSELVSTVSASGLALAAGVGASNVTAASGGVTSNTAALTVVPIYVYVANTNDTVSICLSDPDTGEMSDCVDSGSNATFNVPSHIASNSAQTRVYITNNANNTLSLCTVGDDGLFSSCSASVPGLNGPRGLALDAAETHLYVANNLDDTVSLCSVAGNGSISACTDTGSGFVGPFGMTLNAANTKAYVANLNNNTVSLCDINPISGEWGNCISTGGGFNIPVDIVLDPTGTLAYVANNGNDTVTLCSVNGTTGELSNCADSGGAGFNGVASLAINESGTYVFVSNINTNVMSLCAVDGSTGALSGCADADGDNSSNFASPMDVFVK